MNFILIGSEISILWSFKIKIHNSRTPSLNAARFKRDQGYSVRNSYEFLHFIFPLFIRLKFHSWANKMCKYVPLFCS